jgi:hypothetical protein
MGVGAPRRARTGVRRGRALRIAGKYVDGTANAYYRAILPLRELERRGHRVLWPALDDDDARLSGRPSFDVLLIHHYWREQDLELVQRLSRLGVAVVWDKDDDMSEMPRHVPAFRNTGGRRGVKRAFARSVEIAGTASLMTTPSDHLADRYRELGVDRIEVIENHVAPEHVARQRSRHQGVVIGITAAGEHADDFKALRIDRVLTRLLRAHEGVRVATIGCGLDLPPNRHAHHGYVPIEELVAAERMFDIGLAPLADTPFNRARSNVKLKEYAAAGAMWLASPTTSGTRRSSATCSTSRRASAWRSARERGRFTRRPTARRTAGSWRSHGRSPACAPARRPPPRRCSPTRATSRYAAASLGVVQGARRRRSSSSPTSSSGMRTCSSVSRSRSVTVRSSSVWWSTVTPHGVPISSWRR